MAHSVHRAFQLLTINININYYITAVTQAPWLLKDLSTVTFSLHILVIVLKMHENIGYEFKVKVTHKNNK